MRAVIYPRVSSAVQRERDTIASQLRVLPEYIERQGWTLVRPPETYVDDGASAAAGKLDRRTGLAALLRDAAAGEFDVVVVVDLDRLSRSEDLAERGAILGALQRARVKIASTMTGQLLDLSTSSGDLLSTLSAYFAAEWLRKHRERVTQGRITAATRGRLPAGPPPYGYLYDRATKLLLVHPERGPIVAEIFRRVASGESCSVVADDLQMRGVPRPRGEWCRSAVAKIVRGRAPTGEWVADRGRKLAIAVPPIVDESLWARAQAAVAKSGHRGLRRTRHEYLLESLGVCALCGSPVRIRSADSTAAAAYVCRARMRHRAGVVPCTAPTIRTADADARVWSAIVRELQDPELDRAIVGAVASGTADRRDWEADADGYRRKLDRLQSAEAKILELFTRGKVSEGSLETELARIGRERSALHQQLEACGRAQVAAADTADRLRGASAILTQLRERMPDAPFAARRAIVQLLVRPGGVVVDGRDIRLTLWVERPPGATAGIGDAPCLADGSASS